MLKKTIAVTAMTAALVGGVLVTPGLAAGKGGGKGNTTASTTASISINQVDPHLGDTVTFTTAYPAGSKNLRVQVMCSQADVVVVFGAAGGPGFPFVLGGAASDWRTYGGDAQCHADLFDLVWNGNNAQQVTFLASTDFQAFG